MTSTDMLASARELESLLNPRGIVFVGKLDVSEMDVERSQRFGRPFCYVNPHKPETPAGGPVYTTMAEVPDDYNVAVIRLGAKGVSAAVESCARRGIRKIVVFASGFGESGPEGRELERQLAEVVQRTGVLLIGPNTTENSLEAAPVPPNHRGGLIGLITHSGAQGRAITEGTAIGAGFSRWVPLGNEVGVDAADMINYFAHDPRTAVIAAYVEGFKSGPKLRAALRAANEQNKPVVMLKIGSSKKGAEVAASHTGHLAGADAPIDGLFAQHGVVRVRDVDELLETANLFAKLPPRTGTRCALYSYSGANVAIMAEVADTCGIEIPALTTQTQAGLKERLPPNQRVSNPIDSGGLFSTANPMDKRMAALDLIADDPNIDLVVFGACAAYKWPGEAFSDELPAWAPRARKPVLAIYGSPEHQGAVFANVVRSGVAVFRSFHGCFQALRAFARYQERSLHFRVRPSLGHPLSSMAERALSGAGILSVLDASRLLAEFDISLAREELVHSQARACAAAATMGAPVAMKLMSPDFPHKSDVGLLRMDVSGPAQVRATYKELLARATQLKPDARIDGVLVQEQVGAGVEMIIGLTHDPQMGPTLTIGAGGIYAEILSDVAVRPLPVDADDIREMLDGLKVTKLLAGARGAKPADREGLIALALHVAALAESADGRIAELDLNPVIVQTHRAVAVDALVVSSRAASASPAERR